VYRTDQLRSCSVH